jgi:Family of unknown function (DUF6603)
MAELGDILAGARCAIEPLDTALASEQDLKEFLADFGWDVNVSPASLGAIRTGFAIRQLFDAALAVAQQLESASATPNPSLINSLREAVVGLIDGISGLATAPPTGGMPAPFNQAAFWEDFAPAVVNDLLLRHVEKQQPLVFALLRLSGIAEVTQATPAGAGRIPYKQRTIHWERIPRVISEPDALIREVWGWGAGPGFNHQLLHDILGDSMRALHLPARAAPLSDKLRKRYYAPTNPALANVRTLAVPLIVQSTADRSATAELGVAFTPITPAGQLNQAPAGFAITPLASGSVSGGGPPSSSPFALTVRGGFDADAVVGLELRPSGVGAFADLGGTALDAEVRLGAHPATPLIIIGSPTGFRFEAGGVEAGIGVRGRIDDPELLVRFGTGDAKLAVVIQTSDADGFLGKLIGSNPLRFELGGNMLWSSRTGLHVEGSGGFEIALPLHLNIGIGEIETLTLGLGAGDGGLRIDAGVTGRAQLGPLTAVVEEFGLRANLALGDDIRLALGFKPPKGIGLAVDAGVVSGGGYLFFDYDKGEYAGALELTFSGIVALKAIGLLNTKMPDGSPGFSLLIIITAEFGTGIQLGFGFTLIGVGGLLGLNRTMRLQPLMEGVRTGSINSIMFPQDVVANAPRIISDLRTLFPPEQGKFLIGPMAKLGWGTPTLVSLSLGIIIEIPGNIAILGVLRLALPTDDAAIIVIQVNFAGAIEFDKKRVYFFASLFDSRVLFLTIEGEMALVAAFGDDATFVLSVGGFHPRFQPPPLPVPVPRRIAVNIINTDVARIRVEGYFAVTSNTVQFGARAEVFFGISALNVEGYIGFDALFQFSPFYFIIEISAEFSVNVFGIGMFSVRVRMSLEGPTPWRARGTGSISLLFFDIDVDFDITWGEARDTQLEPIAVLPVIAGELGKADNWKALAPASNNLLVSLRKLDADREGLVLHPLGTLRVSQRAVPLDLAIDKVGNRSASDAHRFSLTPGGALTKRSDLFESFAPAQFQNMADAEKLSRPAFERQHGGIELAPAGEDLQSGAMVKRFNRYELTTIDTNYRRLPIRFHFHAFPRALFEHFLAGASIARSPLSAHVKNQREPFADRIEVRDDGYTVALQSTNAPFSAETAFFASEASARDFVAQQDAGVASTLHVIPAFEVAA